MGDVEDVIAIEEHWPEALARRDRRWLEAHTAADFVFITPDGAVLDRDSYLERSERGNPSIVDRVNAAEQARVVGDVAVLIGRLDVRARDGDGQEHEVQYRYSSVYVRSDGAWRASTAQLTAVSGPSG